MKQITKNGEYGIESKWKWFGKGMENFLQAQRDIVNFSLSKGAIPPEKINQVMKLNCKRVEEMRDDYGRSNTSLVRGQANFQIS